MAIVVAVVLSVMGATVGLKVADAYGYSNGNWDALGCSFSGASSASTSSGWSETIAAPCSDRLRLRMDYKTGGSWYLQGDWWDYVSGTWVILSSTRYADTEMVFGTHQIWVSGAWRQEQYTMTW